MKIFYRPFWKTTAFKHMFIPFFMPLLLFFIFCDYNLNSVVWCYLLLVVLIFLIALIFQLFYIVFMKRGYQKRIIPSVTVNILSSIPVV